MKAMTYAQKLELEIEALESEIQRQRDVIFFLALYAAAVTTIAVCILAIQYA